MQYQFAEPFIVDSSKIASRLGVRATPLDEALAGTLAGYRPGEQGQGAARARSRPSRTRSRANSYSLPKS
jgi:hypothetical protein